MKLTHAIRPAPAAAATSILICAVLSALPPTAGAQQDAIETDVFDRTVGLLLVEMPDTRLRALSVTGFLARSLTYIRPYWLGQRPSW